MDFFENFKLVRKKDNFAVKYKNRTVVLLNKAVFKSILLDNITQGFKKELGLVEASLIKGSPNESKALQLEKTYTIARRKYFKNKKIRNYTPKDKEFIFFVKAITIIQRHNSNNRAFIDAQVEGLSFAKTFPKPNQLATMAAEERLVKYTHEGKVRNDVEHIERIKLSYDDKNTPLMENPRFVAAWKKLEADKATLQEAYFIEDCMISRKEGKVTKKVTDYINAMEKGKKLG